VRDNAVLFAHPIIRDGWRSLQCSQLLAFYEVMDTHGLFTWTILTPLISWNIQAPVDVLLWMEAALIRTMRTAPQTGIEPKAKEVIGVDPGGWGGVWEWMDVDSAPTAPPTRCDQ